MNIYGKAITLNIAYEIERYGGRGLLRWDPIRQATWKEREKSISDTSIWGILLITTEIPPDVTQGSRSKESRICSALGMRVIVKVIGLSGDRESMRVLIFLEGMLVNW